MLIQASQDFCQLIDGQRERDFDGSRVRPLASLQVPRSLRRFDWRTDGGPKIRFELQRRLCCFLRVVEIAPIGDYCHGLLRTLNLRRLLQ